MASKINKKFTLDVTGILDMSRLDAEHDILIEVEDRDEPVGLFELAGKDVKISIGYKDEF